MSFCLDSLRIKHRPEVQARWTLPLGKEGRLWTKLLNVWYIMHQQDRDYIIYYHTVKIRQKKGRIVGCISPIAQAFRARYMISAVIFGTVAAPK